MRDAARSFDCAVENLSDDYTQIAIQGPNGWRTLQKLTDADLTQVKFYWFTHGTVCGLPNTLIARTGYTAEDGFEIYIPSDEATSVRVWNELLGAGEEFGILPCGLGRAQHAAAGGRALALRARNLRHHHALGGAAGPLSSRWTKGEFTGTRALAKQKAARPEPDSGRTGGDRARHSPRWLQGDGTAKAAISAASPADRPRLF